MRAPTLMARSPSYWFPSWLSSASLVPAVKESPSMLALIAPSRLSLTALVPESELSLGALAAPSGFSWATHLQPLGSQWAGSTHTMVWAHPTGARRFRLSSL